jgi:ribosomal protein L37AE/L43A
MSIERAKKNNGRKVCTRCLHKTPARDYPLHDPYGHGRWECSGCGAVYEDAAFKAAQKLHFAEQEREQTLRNNQYS